MQSKKTILKQKITKKYTNRYYHVIAVTINNYYC